MRIWLATVGEPLPIDGENMRLLRTGQFADWLSRNGHEVVFWTGAMDHTARKLRAAETTHVQISDNYKIVLLKGRVYKRSISFARFRNHADVAQSFRVVAASPAAPDVILASYPTEELCRAILDYAEPRTIPVAIDVRDFWPDIFVETLPSLLRPLAPLAFFPLERAARRTLARATALSGMTESAMQWGVAKAGRPRHRRDFYFPFSYRRSGCLSAARRGGSAIRVCFLGTLSKRSNLEVVIDAFRLLQQRGVSAELIICGSGEAESELKARGAGLANVKFMGWLDADQLLSVMQRSDLGALPYTRPDFHLSLPNKCIEYLAGGLPVLSCTEGEVRKLIDARGCGVWTTATAEDISRAIADLVAEPNKLSALKANAAATFADTFDQEIVFRKALDALTKLTGFSPSTPAESGQEGIVQP